MLEILQSADLSTNEAKCYYVLLSNGSLSAGKLAKRTKLHRTTVYDVLARLELKGLLQKEESVYHPLSPIILYHKIKEKEEKLKSSLPNLLTIYQLANT